jgi:hypothetical protein
MKITALRIQPIARTFAIVYSAFGVLFWLAFCISSVDYITLPIGFIAPFLHLNINFNLHRSTGVFYNVLLFVGSVASYAISGWLTSAIAVMCFNAFAKAKGGVDASFVCFRAQQQRGEAISVE